MAVEMKLAVAKRSVKGSTACRRLRRAGKIPGVVYGHQIDPLAIEIAWDSLAPVLKAGSRVVDLDVGGDVEKAMFRDIQWDTFGSEVNHIDFLRIDPNDRVEVEVPIVLKGTAPGVLGGGVLDFHLHSVTIECLAIAIPDNIPVKIGELQLEQAIHVRELELPPNTVVKNDPETVVVQVKHIVEVAEPTAEGAAEPGPTEPEIVGRKVKETEEGEAGEGEKGKEKK
ncbi:MAG TPA: 50S ribosomal protein L25 [Planctomycetaceae bacterium]|jgi:large subunit ribosomal protein L25|nr:50S ribosomal protein L25 [Planctomycetaceae bacterium]